MPIARRLPSVIASSVTATRCWYFLPHLPLRTLHHEPTDLHAVSAQCAGWIGAARAIAVSARCGGDARIYAGRHLWHGEGHFAARYRRDRRADRARQYLPPDVAAGYGGGAGAWRSARIHGLERANPDRLRWLSGVEPRRAAQDHRAGGVVQVADRWQPGVSRSRNLDACAARTRRRHRHDFR